MPPEVGVELAPLAKPPDGVPRLPDGLPGKPGCVTAFVGVRLEGPVGYWTGRAAG
jgi:hypothetical protein